MKNLLSNDTKISFLRIFSGSNLKSTGLIIFSYLDQYAMRIKYTLFCTSTMYISLPTVPGLLNWHYRVTILTESYLVCTCTPCRQSIHEIIPSRIILVFAATQVASLKTNRIHVVNQCEAMWHFTY